MSPGADNDGMALSRATTKGTGPDSDGRSSGRSELERSLSDEAVVGVLPTRGSRARLLAVCFGVLLVVFSVANLAVGHRTSVVREGLSYDFGLNWVAAHRLVDQDPLYDRSASRAEAIELVAPWMSHSNHDPFSSFIGPPPTALLHTPFLLFDRDTAAGLFGILTAAGMALAVLIAAQALPRRSRLPASLMGLAALFLSFPALRTLELGQGHEFVMLGLAVGIWGTARGRWGLAGVGLGVATVLKVSPVLLLVYLVLRGHWKAAWSALVTAVAMFGLAAAIGRPDDLLIWVRDVAPSVSKGTIGVYNQSGVGWLARLFADPTQFATHNALGIEHLLGYACAGAATLALWYVRRRAPLVPLELGVLILVALLAGPLSWDHYFVWAVIPITLMIDLDLWQGRPRSEVFAIIAVASCGVILLYQWVTIPSADTELAWSQRITSSPYTIATLLLTGAATWLLLKPSPTRAETSIPGSLPAPTTP